MARLTWVETGFISEDLYTPIRIEKDADYRESLEKKLVTLERRALNANADEESIKIIRHYRKRILEVLTLYYRADIVRSYGIIHELIEGLNNHPFAVNNLINCSAFLGIKGSEIQFFRSRRGNPSCNYTAIDMLHLPAKIRSKTGNYRFSIPGSPSFYLSNSSYGCWIETGTPPDDDFNVSPVIFDGEQKVLNLAVNIRELALLHDFEESYVHCWLKLLILALATSYRITEAERVFKSEYIISQAIMIVCKSMGFDGVVYYSTRVSNVTFAGSAINLAIFVEYNGDYSKILEHMKIDNPFNYGLYKQIRSCNPIENYELRSVLTPRITNIGDFERQYSYRESLFCAFDRFLFSSWRDKPNGIRKNDLKFGHLIDDI